MGEPGAKGRDVAVSEYLENEEAMARSDRYKLVVATGGPGPRPGRLRDRPPPARPLRERLYDLETDPGETTDLRARADLAPIVADLRRKLLDRLASTRGGRDAVPAGLTEAEALRWCLVPRD